MKYDPGLAWLKQIVKDRCGCDCPMCAVDMHHQPCRLAPEPPPNLAGLEFEPETSTGEIIFAITLCLVVITLIVISLVMVVSA